jgi:hypothetical protein
LQVQMNFDTIINRQHQASLPCVGGGDASWAAPVRGVGADPHPLSLKKTGEVAVVCSAGGRQTGGAVRQRWRTGHYQQQQGVEEEVVSSEVSSSSSSGGRRQPVGVEPWRRRARRGGGEKREEGEACGSWDADTPEMSARGVLLHFAAAVAAPARAATVLVAAAKCRCRTG